MDSDGQLWTRQTGIDWLFHGENTGSIPVGDAKEINGLEGRRTNRTANIRKISEIGMARRAWIIDASDERELIACMGVGRANIIDVQ